jgi:hypothetical protein
MSNTVFVLKNQQGLYLSKQQEWVDGAENQSIYRTRHRDEALNTVFEVSSRDIYLRAETVICSVDAKANPILSTAEPVTPAKAAQIARQQDADLEDEPAIIEEPSADEPPVTDPEDLEGPADPIDDPAIDTDETATEVSEPAPVARLET